MYDARSRSRFRLLVSALTGAATVGSLTAAGVTTGALARAAGDTEATGEAATAPPEGVHAATPARVVRWQDRPRRTVVRRHRVVQVLAAAPQGAAVPAPGESLGGGSVTTPAAGTAAAPGGQPPRAPAEGSGGSGGAGTSQPAPQAPSPPDQPPPPPPPAPEPPVPSTGS